MAAMIPCIDVFLKVSERNYVKLHQFQSFSYLQSYVTNLLLRKQCNGSFLIQIKLKCGALEKRTRETNFLARNGAP